MEPHPWPLTKTTNLTLLPSKLPVAPTAEHWDAFDRPMYEHCPSLVFRWVRCTSGSFLIHHRVFYLSLRVPATVPNSLQRLLGEARRMCLNIAGERVLLEASRQHERVGEGDENTVVG